MGLFKKNEGCCWQAVGKKSQPDGWQKYWKQCEQCRVFTSYLSEMSREDN